MSQLVNFKNAIWTWWHFRRMICNKIVLNLKKKCHRNVWNASDCFSTILHESSTRKRFRWKRPALCKSGQWHFHLDNAPVHNSNLITHYLTKMGIKTVPHPPYSPDLVPCDFCLFYKLRGCRYATIEEIKEAVTKVIDTLTLEDFHGAFQKLLERYKCIAAGGDYFEGDKSLMCLLLI